MSRLPNALSSIKSLTSSMVASVVAGEPAARKTHFEMLDALFWELSVYVYRSGKYIRVGNDAIPSSDTISLESASLASKTPIYTHCSVTAKATYGSRRQSSIASVPLRTTTKPHMARYMNSPSVQIATWKLCKWIKKFDITHARACGVEFWSCSIQ